MDERQRRLEQAFELGLVTPAEALQFGWMKPVIEVPKPRPTLHEIRQQSVKVVAQSLLDLHHAREGKRRSRVSVTDVLMLMYQYGMDDPEHWTTSVWEAKADSDLMRSLLIGLERARRPELN